VGRRAAQDGRHPRRVLAAADGRRRDPGGHDAVLQVRPDRGPDPRDAFALAITPGSILLAIIGILRVSSEWSQRTALITYTLVPKRMRVMAPRSPPLSSWAPS